MAGDIVLDGSEWNRSFSMSLKQMQESGILCDTAIQCTDDEKNPQPILAHACVLAAASPKLKHIVIREAVNSETGIKHVDSMGFGDNVWHFLLEFMYTSRVVIPAEQRIYLLEVEKAAKHLSVKSLIDAVTLVRTPEDDEVEDVTETGEDSKDILDTEDLTKQPNTEQSEVVEHSTTETPKSPPKRKSVRLLQSVRKKKRKIGEFDDDFDYQPSSYIKQEHVCELCGGEFKNRRPLQQHMNKFHPEYKRHFCKQCNAPFNSPQALEDHRRKEHGAKLLECIVCYKEFYTKDAWRRHMRLYHPKVDTLDPMEETSIKVEEVQIDADSIQHVLPADTTTQEEIEGYVEQEQENTEPQGAEQTDGEVVYASIEMYEPPAEEMKDVRQTISMVEQTSDVADKSVDETQTCTELSEGATAEFTDDVAVVAPKSIVIKPRRGRPPKIKKEKPDEKGVFKCTECPKKFATHNGLTAHQHHCHPDVYRGKHVCGVCDRAFGQPGPLEDHLRIKHGAEKLQCTMCEKTFLTRDSLYRHERFKHNLTARRVAQKMRRFECADCGEKFKFISKLEDHQRKAHGAPPLICEICGMEFTAKDTLYRHTRYMHGAQSKDAVSLAAQQNLTEEEKAKNEEAIEWRKQNCKFRCDQCDFVGVSKHMLEEHIRKHSDQKEYKCEHCAREFKYNVGLINHKAKHHPETFSVTYACPECDAVFGRQVYLEDHCRKMHNAPLLQCAYCEKTHVTFDAMYRHKRYDHPSMQKKRIKTLYKCEYCKYTSLSKGAMNNHQLKHTNIRAFICELCGMDFKYKGDLVKHNRQHHMPDYKPPVFHCDICGLECKNKNILQRHFVSRHQKEFSRSFPCPECNQEFGSKTNRDDHIRFDHNGEKIQCQFCKLLFSDVNLWYAHKQKEHPDLASRVLLTEDLFACGICHKQFRKIPLLRRHERYHVTERPYKCEKCGCSFVAKEDLKAHLKVHSGEKPFQCQYCKFSTLRKPALTAHMRVHDESQHLYCPHCSRKYVNIPSLRKHLRVAHDATKEEEDRVLDAMQQQETVYIKVEHDAAAIDDCEALVVASDPNQVADNHTQVFHIQNLSDVGHEIGALIQDTSTLMKSQNPGITTDEVEELVAPDQVSVVQPQIVIQELQETPQQQFIQEQEIEQNQEQVFVQQELIATESQQFEELESVAVANEEEGQGEGEQEVVYIMADGEGGEEHGQQLIQAKDENGQDVLYLKVGDNQYLQMMDTPSFST